MTNQLQRFTQRARRALSLAQEQAELLKSPYLGAEHLLLALALEEGGVAGRALLDLGATPSRIRELALRRTPLNPPSSTGKFDLAPETKAVLAAAVDEARDLGHRDIATEHLLMGLIHDPNGTATQLLPDMNVTAHQVRLRVNELITEPNRLPGAEQARVTTGVIRQGQAIATGQVRMKPETLALMIAGKLAQSDVLAAAELAGKLAAKRAAELLPFHHFSLFADDLRVKCELNADLPGVVITVRLDLTATGNLDLEALTAISAAGLCICDMVNAVDRTVEITNVKLAPPA